MARLKSNQRANLPDSAFAYIDSRGKRRLPINDESHVRNALARFNQVRFEDDDARERARERLLKAAIKHGVVPLGFITGQLESERRETRHVLKDLKEAQAIQTNLLPNSPPDVPKFALAGVCHPSRTVGGDWFDYIPLPGGRTAVVLADVADKGMGAALLMSSTRSIVRMVAQNGRSPGEVLGEVNRILVADLPIRKFITMVYGILDPETRTVTFSSAGHLPPIFIDGGEARAVRAKPQLALGIRSGHYRDHTVDMPEGSRLFLYSDGVIEARNSRSEEYGETRLLEYVNSSLATPQGLLDNVRSFMRRRAPKDDITIVSVDARR